MADRVAPVDGALGERVDFGEAVEEGEEAATDDGVDVSVGIGRVGDVESGYFADERAGHGHEEFGLGISVMKRMVICESVLLDVPECVSGEAWAGDMLGECLGL